MSVRGTPENRITQLEREVQRLRLDALATVGRHAKPNQIRKGWWVGKLTEELEPGETAEVAVEYWSVTDSEWKDSGETVEARDYFMREDAAPIPAETKVYVAWNNNVWVILGTTEGAGGGAAVMFELTEALALEGEAAAVVCTLADGEYEASEIAIAVCDPYRGPGVWSGQSGYQGIARPRTDGKYDVVWMETKARFLDFTLDEKVGATTAEQAAATVGDNGYWGGKDPRDGEGKVTIYFPGTDGDALFPRALAGARGLGIYDERLGRYDAYVCQQMVLRGTAVLTENMCGSTATFDNFVGTTFSLFNQAPDPLPTTANNPRLHRGKSGDIVALEWNEPEGEWQVYDVQRHALTVSTAIRVEGTQFQHKTIDAALEVCGDESDWTAWHEGTPDCPEEA